MLTAYPECSYAVSLPPANTRPRHRCKSSSWPVWRHLYPYNPLSANSAGCIPHRIYEDPLREGSLHLMCDIQPTRSAQSIMCRIDIRPPTLLTSTPPPPLLPLPPGLRLSRAPPPAPCPQPPSPQTPHLPRTALASQMSLPMPCLKGPTCPLGTTRPSGKMCSQSPLPSARAATLTLPWSTPAPRSTGSTLPFRKNCLQQEQS